MDTYFVNLIGEMLVNIIDFVLNLSSGYILILLLVFISALTVIYFRFFTDLLTKPKW